MAAAKELEIPLGIDRVDFTKRPESAVLHIRTDKPYTGGIASDATVYWHGEGHRSHAFGLGGGGDWSKRLCKSPNVRATQGAIDKQHAAVFTPEVVAELVATAKSYYAEGKDKI